MTRSLPPLSPTASLIRWVMLAAVVGLLLYQVVSDRWQPAADAPRRANEPHAEVGKDDPSKKKPVTDEVAPTEQEIDLSVDDAAKPTNAPAKAKPDGPRVEGLKVHNVIVKSLDGEVAFHGTVDLSATLKRIDAQQSLTQFQHDGVEFKNLERRLPNKPRGHYREWVSPTSGLRGPGPQRVITGKTGEAFYTWDHYEHFLPIRKSR